MQPPINFMVIIAAKELSRDIFVAVINSLQQQSLPPSRVIFATRKQHFVDALPDNVQVIIQNSGKSAALNTAISAARAFCTHIAIMDDDCIPDRDWLKNLKEEYEKEENENVASIGGPNYGALSDNFIGRLVDVVLGAKFVTAGTRYGRTYAGTRSVDHNPGCNTSYSMSVISNNHKLAFDIDINVAEDVVFDYQLRKLNYIILFTPHAFVWHKRRPTVRKFFKQIYSYGKGRTIVNKKYPELKSSTQYIPWVVTFGWPLLFFLPLWMSVGLILLYLGVCLYGTLNTAMPHHNLKEKFCAAFLVPVAHVAWGLGYLRGIL